MKEATESTQEAINKLQKYLINDGYKIAGDTVNPKTKVRKRAHIVIC